MRTYIYTLVALLSVAFALTSCSKNDDDADTYSVTDCYISSFTLGQLRRTVNTKTSSGADTTYQVSYTGAYYKTKIDQREQTITLVTPLPVGTRPKALISIGYVGVLGYASASNPNSWTVYSTTDSIDFSEPQIFRVYSTDGNSYRDYRVTLEIYDVSPDEYQWSQRATAVGLDGVTAQRAVEWNGNLFVAAKTGSQVSSLNVAPSDILSSPPTAVACTGADDADVRTLQIYNNKLWMSTTTGAVLTSDDGQAWTKIATSAGQNIQLIAASDEALYAWIEDTTNGCDTIVASSTDGSTWDKIALDAPIAQFPKSGASVSYVQTNGNRRVLFAGASAASASTTMTWNLLEGSTEGWTLFTDPAATKNVLPKMNNICIVERDGQFIALEQSLDTYYLSEDNGVTWKDSDVLVTPSELKGNIAPMGIAPIGKSLWLVVGNQIWQLRKP